MDADEKQPFLDTHEQHEAVGRPRTRVVSATVRFVTAVVFLAVTFVLICSSSLTWSSCAEPSDVLERMHHTLWTAALPSHSCKMHNTHAAPFGERLERMFLAVPSAKSARAALKRYTKVHHIAGERADYTSALRTIREWSTLLGAPVSKPESVIYDAGTPESQDRHRRHRVARHDDTGVEVWADTYSVWLDQPVSAALWLAPPSITDDPEPLATWVADLHEAVLKDDPTSGKGMPPFHGFSHSGRASGNVVYAGLGRREDFRRLEELGVDIRDKIVLVRYGGLFRGLKVRLAQEYGAVGVLIYSDPLEDGEVTEANGVAHYPHGPARQPTSIQRGSVQALSFYPGDPATPGKPSYRNATRPNLEDADSIPRIPSLPISYPNAKRLLDSIANHGIHASKVSSDFAGSVPGADYWTGPSTEIATMINEMDMKTRDIWNVYAVIPGQIDDERVYVGNHRDAWTFGAVDPSSGSAVMHEVIRAFGTLLRTGWRPMRTIVFASWDAEEYGLVGSTEFGEDFADMLVEKAAIYHNLDVAVAGSRLEGRASPSLAPLMHSAAALVPHPNGTGTLEFGEINALGSGSDFTVFLQRLGIAATDMSFRATHRDPVYHYHSNYDSFHWMETYGDPDFTRHEALARVYGLSVLRSATPAVLPIDVAHYATELYNYLDKVQAAADASGADLSEIPLSQVRLAIDRVVRAAAFVHQDAVSTVQQLDQIVSTSVHTRSRCTPNTPEILPVLSHIRRINNRLIAFEQGFIDSEGLSGREWYRHLGVAPGRWLGYGATTFPGLLESFSLDGGEGAEHEIERLVQALDRIAQQLVL
ncbi:glutamate carboxypeptidase II [Malassezia cuniculi]|uniref:Glutamate carboxypeptidase II n=1 Tax=Malassezia cuniculi TaxID=948313 RepID=A0AAF0ERE2_9BASI|nr:glutamate carboxypeptidase II [Malassezia cuniculi]